MDNNHTNICCSCKNTVICKIHLANNIEGVPIATISQCQYFQDNSNNEQEEVPQKQYYQCYYCGEEVSEDFVVYYSAKDKYYCEHCWECCNDEI